MPTQGTSTAFCQVSTEVRTMSIIFEPESIGTLEVPNRLIRSATAEYMSDLEGKPEQPLADL